MARAAAQARPSSAWLRFLGAFAAAAPAPAHAGAWLERDGRDIWSGAVGERDELTFVETSSYLEAPLSEGRALVATSWAEQNQTTEEGWRGEVEVGLKFEVERTDRVAVAVQASALWEAFPGEGCGEGGAELRVMGGLSLPPSWLRGGFVNAEAAGRALDGGCTGRRLELSAGYRPRENVMAMGQVFLDARRDDEETVKAQLSLVRFTPSGRAIQLGVRARIDDGDPEPALVLSFWDRGRPRRDQRD